jgi:hypothetical protein
MLDIRHRPAGDPVEARDARAIPCDATGQTGSQQLQIRPPLRIRMSLPIPHAQAQGRFHYSMIGAVILLRLSLASSSHSHSLGPIARHLTLCSRRARHVAHSFTGEAATPPAGLLKC